MLLAMWKRSLRWLILVLVGLAFLGETTVQAMRPSSVAAAATASNPMLGCAEMPMAHETNAPVPYEPITPDCLEFMQCLGTPDRIVKTWLEEAPVTYAEVAYWSTDHSLTGLSYPPCPFPPKSSAAPSSDEIPI